MSKRHCKWVALLVAMNLINIHAVLAGLGGLHLYTTEAQSSDLHPAPDYVASHWRAHTGIAVSRPARHQTLCWQSAGYLHVVMTTDAASHSVKYLPICRLSSGNHPVLITPTHRGMARLS